MTDAATATSGAPPAPTTHPLALPEDDGLINGFDHGRGRLLLRLVDLTVVLLGTGPVLTMISEGTPGPKLALAMAADAVLVVLCIQHLRVVLGRGWPWPPQVTLTATALLCYGLLPVLGPIWLITPLFVMTGVISTLPWRRWWPLYAVVVIAEPLLALLIDTDNAAFRTLQLVLTSAVMWGLARAVALAEELSRARQELAELAVVRERLRVARDLHDSLGQSLTAIGLQAELAQRWNTKGDPARVGEHLQQVLDLTRSTGVEMRGLVATYRKLTLAGEASAAGALLRARGITCRVDVPDDLALTAEAEQVLAWTLREAATNVVRHSDARRATITVISTADGVKLVVANDGAHTPTQPTQPTAKGGGNGLLGIADRALGLGGWSQSRLSSDGRFELTVNLPPEHGSAGPTDTPDEDVA